MSCWDKVGPNEPVSPKVPSPLIIFPAFAVLSLPVAAFVRTDLGVRKYFNLIIARACSASNCNSFLIKSYFVLYKVTNSLSVPALINFCFSVSHNWLPKDFKVSLLRVPFKAAVFNGSNKAATFFRSCWSILLVSRFWR